jgi:3-methyladenine DNA glycosylase AlkD
MQAYMKSTLPFHGVGTPERRRLVALCLQGRMCEGATALEAAVLALWRGATHREERYAALDLLRVPAHRRLVGLSLLPAVEEMIRSGPWWDFNDEISGRVLPLLLQRHPEVMKPLLRRWAQGHDLWFRRAAMLCQRRLKSGCDAALLYDCIRPSLGPGPLAGEFFIRKGMGWALRERAYAAPDEVRAFCAEHRDQLAPLSRREALKALARGAAAGV